MGFRSLRVINEDIVAPGGGFPNHPHRDMEIFSYIVEGKLQHRDSLGNTKVLAPGEIQLMGAGRGVSHSEFNPSPTHPVHFLQIWIVPESKNLAPEYNEWIPPEDARPNSKVLVISRDGRSGSAKIRQDADVWRLRLAEGGEETHELTAGRGAWIQCIKGSASIGVETIAAGDAAFTEDAGQIRLLAGKGFEALLFDLA